jgi:hypothetical protein
MTKTITVQAQQKWEHLALTRKSDTYLISEINLLGQEGWEMVTALYYKDAKGLMCWTGFLKRPCTGQSPAPAGNAAGPSAAQPSKEPEDASPGAGFDLDGDEFGVRSE